MAQIPLSHGFEPGPSANRVPALFALWPAWFFWCAPSQVGSTVEEMVAMNANILPAERSAEIKAKIQGACDAFAAMNGINGTRQ